MGECEDTKRGILFVFFFRYHRLERTLAGDLTAGGRSFPEITIGLLGAGRATGLGGGDGKVRWAIATWCGR